MNIKAWENKKINISQFNDVNYKNGPLICFQIDDKTIIAVRIDALSPRDFKEKNNNSSFMLDLSIPPEEILMMRGNITVYFAKKEDSKTIDPNDNIDIDKQYKMGVELFNSNNFDGAIKIFLELENFLLKADTHNNLRHVYYLLAQNYFYKFTALKHSLRFTFQDNTNFSESKQLFDNAFGYCKKSIELYDYQDANSYFTMGGILMANEDFASAALNFIRAKNLGDPEAQTKLEEINKMPLVTQIEKNFIKNTLPNEISKYKNKFTLR